MSEAELRQILVNHLCQEHGYSSNGLISVAYKGQVTMGGDILWIEVSMWQTPVGQNHGQD